jgi:hypothetical protein
MYFIDDFLLTDDEQINLSFQIKGYCLELEKNYKKFSINIHIPKDFYKNLSDINFNWTVKDYYTNFYNYLMLCISCSLNHLNESLLYYKYYDFDQLINSVVIYGSSIFYLDKLINNPLFIKTQSEENLKSLKHKLNNIFKNIFYNEFQFYTKQFLQSKVKEPLLYPKFEREIKLLNFLVKDCCERINDLNFHTFLA